MVKRNLIPRRLIGAGGIRLFDIQGITYPPELLQGKGMVPIRDTVPDWGITTEEAARILNCRRSSARMILNKLEVEKCKVRRKGLVPLLYWHREQVLAISSARPREVYSLPSYYMSAYEVCRTLSVSRSTLCRYVRNGLLIPETVRHRSGRGVRHKQFFLKSEVRRLRYHLNALRYRGAVFKENPTS